MKPGLERTFWRVVGLTGLLVGCAPRGVVKPHAPDMTELVESYDSPTGTFDAADTVALAATVGAASALLASTQITTRLRDLLSQLIEPVTPGGSGDSSADNGFHLDVKANGYLEATRICPGWTLPSEVNADNGSLHATATFSQAGLDPVVWGTVADCLYRVADTRIELSAAGGADSLRVYWGEGVDRDTIQTRDLVSSLNLSVAVDGKRADLAVDFRVVDGGAIEYLVPVDSGTLVVRANENGSFILTSRNGSYACDASFDCSRKSSNGN